MEQSVYIESTKSPYPIHLVEHSTKELTQSIFLLKAKLSIICDFRTEVKKLGILFENNYMPITFILGVY